MTILKVKPSDLSVASAKAYRDKIMEVLYNATLKYVGCPSVATASLLSESGNLNGSYSYYVTYYTADGETHRSSQSNTITASNQKITLTNISVSSNSDVIGRRIYRQPADASDVIHKQLVVDIDDNTTTTYVDNIADTSLGVPAPQMNNTGGALYLHSQRMLVSNGYSSAFGVNSLLNNTGYANTALGINSMTANTTGLRCTAAGMFSLYENTTGSNNSAFGVHALNDNVSGDNNCSFGYMSSQLGNGSNNSSFGTASLTQNLSGSYNCAFGSNSLYLNKSSSNVAMGYYTLSKNVTGYGNIAIGTYAGYYETGSNQLFIDNSTRASEADARVKSLIYGIFNADYREQLVSINATLKLAPQNTAPTSNISRGSIYSNSSDGHLYYHNGTAWKQLDN